MAEIPWNAEFDRVLRSFCRLSRPDALIDPDAPFTSAGVDSLGILGLIGATEAAFDVELPISMLTVEALFTPAAFWAVVQEVVGASSGHVT